MAGHKETPRQKMISMMYLFYTALLALNVSVDILNAFTLVNNGMERTIKNFGAKNEILYNDFKNQLEVNKAKVEPYYIKAQEVKKESEELIGMLEKAKDMIVGYTEYGDKNAKNVEYEYKDDKGSKKIGKSPRAGEVPLEWIKKKDNYDKPMEILLGYSSQGNTGEATKIKKAFAEYQKHIYRILEKDTLGLKLGLETDDEYNTHAQKKQSWELNTFYHTVLSADVVLLNKYITDIRNIEYETVKRLYGQINAKDYKFDVIQAAVVPKANIVVSGAPYEADVFVAAFSTSDTPTVLVRQGAKEWTAGMENGATKVNEIEGGVAKYSVGTGGTGEFTYAGVIQVKDPGGEVKSYPFSSAYSVIKPTATVSATKMNVVYRGLNNPISVSAPGFTNENVTLSASGGGSLIRKSPGNYEFVPTVGGKDKEVTFRISAKNGEGSQNLGSFVYRIKNVPPPLIQIAGSGDGPISKDVFISRPVLQAVLVDFLFDGIKFTVNSFYLYAAHPQKGTIVDGKVSGGVISGEFLSKLQKAPVGTKVFISQVRVTGPSGPVSAAGINLVFN